MTDARGNAPWRKSDCRWLLYDIGSEDCRILGEYEDFAAGKVALLEAMNRGVLVALGPEKWVRGEETKDTKELWLRLGHDFKPEESWDEFCASGKQVLAMQLELTLEQLLGPLGLPVRGCGKIALQETEGGIRLVLQYIGIGLPWKADGKTDVPTVDIAEAARLGTGEPWIPAKGGQ